MSAWAATFLARQGGRLAITAHVARQDRGPRAQERPGACKQGRHAVYKRNSFNGRVRVTEGERNEWWDAVESRALFLGRMLTQASWTGTALARSTPATPCSEILSAVWMPGFPRGTSFQVHLASWRWGSEPFLTMQTQVPAGRLGLQERRAHSPKDVQYAHLRSMHPSTVL